MEQLDAPSAVEVAEIPQDHTLAGIPFQARRLGLMEIYEIGDTYVLAQEAQAIKSTLSNFAGQDRMELAIKLHERMPRGKELRDLTEKLFHPGNVPDELACRVLHASLNPGPGDSSSVDIEHITKLIEQGSSDEVVTLLRYAMSTDDQKKK